MKRLLKGYGSIYKLSGSRRKPYVARVTVGFKSDGRPNYRYLGYYAKADESILALTEYNKNPYDIDARRATISDMWDIFKQRRFPVISENGKGIYTDAFGHLKPLHNKPIADLRTYELQSLIGSIDRKWQTKAMSRRY
ncbi:hypothetical protein IMSAG049_01392 [Clostridiales bacterium]|nr:hypothetical protein IMSAG049_01392 [Clostridiales bacterium]